MPTYTFSCVACHNEFDKNVSHNDIESVMCDACGYRTKRIYSFTGIVWSPTRNSGHS
jgi:putative FmdB family regulatory protein